MNTLKAGTKILVPVRTENGSTSIWDAMDDEQKTIKVEKGQLKKMWNGSRFPATVVRDEDDLVQVMSADGIKAWVRVG